MITKKKKEVSLILGVIILLNVVIFSIISGGRWFEVINPETGLAEVNSLKRVFGPFYMLGYFTVQTNFFLGIALIIFYFFPESNKSNSILMGSVSLITITFIVYWLLLAPSVKVYEWLNPYATVSTLFLHGINPIIGFVFVIMIRREIILNKRIVGYCSYYAMFFVAYHAILYGAGATVHPDDPNSIKGATIYSFLDIQRILYMDLRTMPALAVIINVIILIISPLLPVGINFLWAKSLKLRYTDVSYYSWMDKIKAKKS